MNLRKIIKLYDKGNVCVVGLRGTGKDMLSSNVCIRRKLKYISNIDYGGDFVPYSKDVMSLGGNTFNNFKDGTVKPYKWDYPDGTDVYLSDIGVYFPSQECGYLDKHEKGLPLFMALSRQLGDSNVHLNVQNLERAWTKIREQSDIYIRCEWCKVFFGKLVIQKVMIYQKMQSCIDRVPKNPFDNAPLLCPRAERQLWKMKALDYRVAHGEIKPLLLIYFNRSSYDTRYFKTLLEGVNTDV